MRGLLSTTRPSDQKSAVVWPEATTAAGQSQPIVCADANVRYRVQWLKADRLLPAIPPTGAEARALGKVLVGAREQANPEPGNQVSRDCKGRPTVAWYRGKNRRHGASALAYYRTNLLTANACSCTSLLDRYNRLADGVGN
jgi:hypothetical protein